MKKYLITLAILVIAAAVITSYHSQENAVPPTTSSSTSPFSANAYVNDGSETPIIDSITPAAVGSVVRQTFTIKGKYLNGFEGGTDVVFVNSKGQKGVIEAPSPVPAGGTTLTFTVDSADVCSENTGYSGLPCPSYLHMVPGEYEVYVQPWSIPSNKLKLIVQI